MPDYNTLPHRVLDALAEGDPATEDHVQSFLARNSRVSGEEVVAFALDSVTRSAALVRAQRLLEDEIARAYRAEDDPLDAAFGERTGDRRSAEARRLLALVHAANARLLAPLPSVDHLARWASDLQAFWRDHQSPDRLADDECPADARTDLSRLDRTRVTIRDTRREHDDLEMRSDTLKGIVKPVRPEGDR